MTPEPRWPTTRRRPEREVEVWLDGALRRVPLYLRASLRHGHAIAGPAVVVQEDTTVCIPARLRRDAWTPNSTCISSQEA